jgi:hypothetical protein
MNLRKNISLKKQVKMLNLISFLDNSDYIFVVNDLSLNASQILSTFKNDNNIQTIVVKSKILLNILIEKNVLQKDTLFIKGPVILVGINNVNTFKLFLDFIEIKNKNNLDLLFVIVNNFIIYKKNISIFFMNFFKNLSFFQYYNCLNIKYKKELLNTLLFSTYFIESKLIKNLNLK